VIILSTFLDLVIFFRDFVELQAAKLRIRNAGRKAIITFITVSNSEKAFEKGNF